MSSTKAESDCCLVRRRIANCCTTRGTKKRGYPVFIASNTRGSRDAQPTVSSHFGKCTLTPWVLLEYGFPSRLCHAGTILILTCGSPGGNDMPRGNFSGSGMVAIILMEFCTAERKIRNCRFCRQQKFPSCRKTRRILIRPWLDQGKDNGGLSGGAHLLRRLRSPLN